MAAHLGALDKVYERLGKGNRDAIAEVDVAISSVVYLVSSVVFGDPVAVAQTALFSTIAGWAWFYLPLVRFKKDD
ncbi:MAG TPA: hypothetical protein VGB33_08115 [Acidimicrobiia bacterium]